MYQRDRLACRPGCSQQSTVHVCSVHSLRIPRLRGVPEWESPDNHLDCIILGKHNSIRALFQTTLGAQGRDTVQAYLQECKAVGFDVVEVSAHVSTLPEEDLLRLVEDVQKVLPVCPAVQSVRWQCFVK